MSDGVNLFPRKTQYFCKPERTVEIRQLQIHVARANLLAELEIEKKRENLLRLS